MPRGKRKGAPASAEERIAKIKREGPVVGVNDPDDPTPRKEIDVKKLDLDKSYVGSIKLQRSTRPEKDRPWEVKERDIPIHDGRSLPLGWHSREDDLDPLSVLYISFYLMQMITV